MKYAVNLTLINCAPEQCGNVINSSLDPSIPAAKIAG
jgi:hypothetical protein